MNASSQTPPEAPRLEPVPIPWPPNGGHQNLCAYVGGIGPHCTCTNEPPAPPAAADAPASADVPAHLVVDAVEPQLPECFTCFDRQAPLYPDPHGRRYPSGAQLMFCGTCVPDATPAEAVTAVVAAEMAKDDPVTARDIARAEIEAGIAFDPARIQAAADAARQQGHAEGRAEAREEFQAELDERGRQLAAVAGSARQRDAVLRLLEGRPGDYHLPVAMVAAAAEYAATPYDEMPPMTLRWDSADGVDIPRPGDTRQRAVIKCRTPYGTRADLVVENDDCQRLANLVGHEVRDIHAPCPTPGCGTDHDWDSSDPGLVGWSRLEVAVLGDGPRWYCCDICVFDALARAAHEHRVADHHAELDGGL